MPNKGNMNEVPVIKEGFSKALEQTLLGGSPIFLTAITEYYCECAEIHRELYG